MQPLDQQVGAALRSVMLQKFAGPLLADGAPAGGDGPAPLPEVTVTVSDRPDLGDFASPLAFALGKRLRRPPMEIALSLAEGLLEGYGDLVADAHAAAPGFVNVRVAPKSLALLVEAIRAADGRIADSTVGAGTKVVVEHTNINPNKAAHVGHLRNACLGDSVVRLLRRSGYEVEVQNYIDDTGVQVADVVVGLRHLGLSPAANQPFDRFCSDVYVAVQQAYASQPELMARRAEVQQAIEHGEGELATYAHEVAARIAAANLATMGRVGVAYNLLTWESDILGLGFWQKAFARLRDEGVIRLEPDGPHAGCWVLPFGEGTTQVGEKAHSDDKVLVTSKGIATYTAKDIAYQLWKFGLLGLDFRYRPWEMQPDGTLLWTGTREEGSSDAPEFAHADHVINVIDVKQGYLQQVVYDSLRRLGFAKAADASEHLAYGVVSLSAAAARELGVDVEEGSAAVAMSGRRGVQVLADLLLDRMATRLLERADGPTAEAMAAGAVRYYLLRFSNNQPIAFDFDDALRTTGETGVYLQYALVRAAGILRKLGATPADLAMAVSFHADDDTLDRALALKLAQYPRVLRTAADERAPQQVAKYAFELATAFSTFYDNTTPLVQEANAATKMWRVALVNAFAAVLRDVMAILGVPVVQRL